MSRKRLTITGDGPHARDGRAVGRANTNEFCKRLSVAALPVPCKSLLAGSSSVIHADTLTLTVAERPFQMAPREERAFKSLIKDGVRGFARSKWH
jgi:hypothetical protein